jgi:hypothetical protein
VTQARPPIVGATGAAQPPPAAAVAGAPEARSALAAERLTSARRLAELRVVSVAVFLATRVFFAVTTDTALTAGIVTGAYLLLVVLASLSLDRRQIALTAALGAALAARLQILAGANADAWVGAALLIALAAVISACGVRRTMELVDSARRERVRRAHLARPPGALLPAAGGRDARAAR